MMASQARQLNFSRTVCTTFHCLGTTSSVSVTSSPSLTRSPPPQQEQALGRGQHDPLARQVGRQRAPA